MLARVAENLYWMGRQLERAENTARLVNATTQVLLDSPVGIELGWDELTRVMGFPRTQGVTENQVVQLLLLDQDNLGSIVVSLRQARENARSLREVLPREAWEQLNALHLRAPALMMAALDRSRRDKALREVIEARLMLAGLLNETMSHDAAFQFLRMGALLERADMTTRIVDISSAVVTTAPDGLGMETTWVSILKALSAFQMYRRHKDVRISPKRVVSFLLSDSRFPRAVRYCLENIEGILAELPDPADPLRATRQAARLLSRVEHSMEQDGGLPVLIDEVQRRFCDVHNAIHERYFARPKPLAPLLSQAQDGADA